MSAKVHKFLRQEKEIENQAVINAEEMKKNIFKLINKKVAGRQEGIEKVEGYLDKQERFNQEQKE